MWHKSREKVRWRSRSRDWKRSKVKENKTGVELDRNNGHHRWRNQGVHRGENPADGFSDGSKLAAIVRTLHLNSVYFSLKNYVWINFTLSHYQGQVEESALLNSEATEIFINHTTVTRLWLGTKKLNFQRLVYNVDGTMNRHGTIMHACDLMVKQGNKKVQ